MRYLVVMSKSDEEEQKQCVQWNAAKRHIDRSSFEVVRLSAAGQRHSDMLLCLSVSGSIIIIYCFWLFAF